MPSGKTHDKINISFLIIFSALLLLIGFDSLTYSMFYVVGYLFGTFLCGPDLDIKSNMYKRWKYLKFIWWPYRKAFPHRSIWTHGFLIGDVIRMVYLLLWLSPFLIIISQMNGIGFFDMLIHFSNENQFELNFFAIGLVMSSTAHIFADILVSDWKKLIYKRK